MTLTELLTIASSGYSNNKILDYWDVKVRREKFEMKEDMLALFLLREIASAYGDFPDKSDVDPPKRAICAIERTIEELNAIKAKLKEKISVNDYVNAMDDILEKEGYGVTSDDVFDMATVSNCQKQGFSPNECVFVFLNNVVEKKENKMKEPIYSTYDGQVIYADKDHGAVLLDDEMWYPFCYFNNGHLDIWNNCNGFLKASTAYKMAKQKFA